MIALCCGNIFYITGPLWGESTGDFPLHWPFVGGIHQWLVDSLTKGKYCTALRLSLLIYWGRVTHICVSKLTSIASDNGLSPGRRQAIIWNNAGILLIGPLGTNFSEISIEIQIFCLKKIHLKKSSAKCRPFCLSLNVLNEQADQKLSLWCTRPSCDINVSLMEFYVLFSPGHVFLKIGYIVAFVIKYSLIP